MSAGAEVCNPPDRDSVVGGIKVEDNTSVVGMRN
jgi:hypothetical protein